MRQIIVFKTLDELHDYAEKSHSHIRFEFESDDLILVKMHNEPIARLAYSSVTWNNDGLETYMINWWNVEKFEFLFNHIDLLDQLATSEDVKEIDVRSASIRFIYKENYSITYLDEEVSALMILRIETEDLQLIASPKISQVFEILDENIKDF